MLNFFSRNNQKDQNMLIVLKNPVKISFYEILAVDLQSFNMISVSQREKIFKLGILKLFDGHLSSHSDLNFVLGSFDSYKECLEFFQTLLDALKNGESVFDLRREGSLKNTNDEKKQQGFL